ncbi:MAG: tRNA lysidine(34) synthetase TilS [Actinobacteria bacterium]|nr:tRNA lysidine(34) synthetase TilS [Actinomycetota bacterium]MCG2802135.1 tRNA lysidine(34) synthetase TilS [Cellulomonas sp.]
MSGPPQAVAATRAAVRAALTDLPPGPVLVACSGGPDSLALAAATAFVAARTGRPAGAVVVDHRLQDGSAQVAAHAGAQCRGLGLDPVLVVEVEVGADGGPEAAARTERHRALADAAARTGAVAVLLGHTLDDQAEQVLLGLARGSGVRSLGGMPAARDHLLRPFLGLRREQTIAACAAAGLTPWHDPTNAAGPGLRTAVRTRVLPLLTEVLGPGVAAALVRTGDQLQEVAEVIGPLAADLLDRASAEDGWDAATLAAAPAGVRRAALHALALTAGASPGALARSHVLSLDALVVDWHGQGPVDLPGGLRLQRSCGRLQLARPGPGGT